MNQIIILSGLFAILSAPSVRTAPSVKSDKDVVVDVSPFFKMDLHRDMLSTILDIDVLSGLVKVGYDRLPGHMPNVAVQVFGFGTTRPRPKIPTADNLPSNFDGSGGLAGSVSTDRFTVRSR